MVAEILLSLPNLIDEFESRPRPEITFKWSSTRKRSAVGLNPLSSSPQRRCFCHRSSSPPSLERTRHGESETEKQRATVNGEFSSSPTTPLCFPPSDSDGKSEQSRNKVSKNLLRSCLMKPQLELRTSINYEIKLTQYIIQPTPTSENHNSTQIQINAHQEGVTMDKMEDVLQTSEDPTGFGLDKANLVSPLCISALNPSFGVGHSQHKVLSDARARATEARRKRIVKRRELRNAAVVATAATINSRQC
ncbi:hypothetical protein U1Q18_005977 [Sarracenia purpurea var. burkii]